MIEYFDDDEGATSLSLNVRGGGGSSFPQVKNVGGGFLSFPFGGIVYIELEGPMKIVRFFTILVCTYL